MPKSGPKERGQGYELELKDNVCVRCGASEHLSRFHVVPHTYRKYFPLHLKSHSQHDVVVLCVDCHFLGNKSVSDLMAEVEREYGITQTRRNLVNKCVCLSLCMVV